MCYPKLIVSCERLKIFKLVNWQNLRDDYWLDISAYILGHHQVRLDIIPFAMVTKFRIFWNANLNIYILINQWVFWVCRIWSVLYCVWSISLVTVTWLVDLIITLCTVYLNIDSLKEGLLHTNVKWFWMNRAFSILR